MFSWLTNIGFGSLAALWVAALIPLLVFAYLTKHKSKKQTVSSVLLLQNLKKHRIIKKRFKPPWRFFLELAALSLLALAATSPYFKTDKSHTAILLDNSLSMKANYSDAEVSRFEIGIQQLNDRIASSSSKQSYSLFITSPKLELIGKSAISASEVSALIDGLSSEHSADALDESLAELSSSNEYSEILVISDKKLSASGKVNHIQIGKPVENVYISGLSHDKAKSQLVANFALSGSSSKQITVEYSMISSTNRLTPLGKKRINVSNQNQSQLLFDLPKTSSQNTAYKVEIVENDALVEDNVAWISTQSASSNSLLLVSSLANKGGLGRIPDLNVTEIAPDEFTNLSTQELQNYQLIIFHHSAPSNLPPVPTLLILPPTGNNIVPVSEEVLNPKVTSWIRSSEVTRYLRVPLLEPRAATIFKTPIWAREIIRVEQGPILIVGENSSTPAAAVGFELLPFEGDKTPSSSILTLNLFRWLSSNRIELRSSLLSGTNVRLEPGNSWVIKSPNGRIDTIEAPNGESTFYPLANPGIYIFSSISENTRRVDQANTKLTAVNNFYPLESATYSIQSISPADLDDGIVELTDVQKSLWQALVLIVLALLIAEILITAFLKKQGATI